MVFLEVVARKSFFERVWVDCCWSRKRRISCDVRIHRLQDNQEVVSASSSSFFFFVLFCFFFFLCENKKIFGFKVEKPAHISSAVQAVLFFEAQMHQERAWQLTLGRLLEFGSAS